MKNVAEIKRSIGLSGAVFTLVGFTVGVSIYILPGQLAANAGPGVVLSFIIAALMASLSCLVAAQIGSIFPTSGASLVVISKLLSPFLGFAQTWLLLGTASVGTAFLAYGLADYLALMVPGLDRKTVAVLAILSFGGVNLLGARASVAVQGLMVITFIVALIIFVTAGLFKLDASLLVPFMPNGFSAVLAAAIPAYFSWTGFMVIIEIGGEVRDPGRNIPLALLISFVIVLLIYTAVTIVLVGVMPWYELGANNASVGQAAGLILPAALAKFIGLTAILAAATSINALLLAYSRDVLALARAGMFPRVFAGISPTHGEPVGGVVLLTTMAVVAAAIGASILQYVIIVVMAVMLLQILLAVAAIRIPTVMPEEYKRSRFKINNGPLKLCAVALIVGSTMFLFIGILEDSGAALMALVYVAVGVVYYQLGPARKGKVSVERIQS